MINDDKAEERKQKKYIIRKLSSIYAYTDRIMQVMTLFPYNFLISLTDFYYRKQTGNKFRLSMMNFLLLFKKIKEKERKKERYSSSCWSFYRYFQQLADFDRSNDCSSMIIFYKNT